MKRRPRVRVGSGAGHKPPKEHPWRTFATPRVELPPRLSVKEVARMIDVERHVLVAELAQEGE